MGLKSSDSESGNYVFRPYLPVSKRHGNLLLWYPLSRIYFYKNKSGCVSKLSIPL